MEYRGGEVRRRGREEYVDISGVLEKLTEKAMLHPTQMFHLSVSLSLSTGLILQTTCGPLHI